MNFSMTENNKTNKGVKPSSVEMESRVSTIYRLLLSGMRRQEIIQYVANKTDWNVCDRTLDSYIEKARVEIADVTDEERKTALGMAYKRLDMLYFKSLLINDYKTALAIQKEINDLSGLKIIRKEIEHSGEVEQTVIILPANSRLNNTEEKQNG